MGQVPYDFGPNFKKGFLAKEQATRTFEIIISLDFFLNSQIFLMMDTLVTALGKCPMSELSENGLFNDLLLGS